MVKQIFPFICGIFLLGFVLAYGRDQEDDVTNIGTSLTINSINHRKIEFDNDKYNPSTGRHGERVLPQFSNVNVLYNQSNIVPVSVIPLNASDQSSSQKEVDKTAFISGLSSINIDPIIFNHEYINESSIQNLNIINDTAAEMFGDLSNQYENYTFKSFQQLPNIQINDTAGEIIGELSNQYENNTFKAFKQLSNVTNNIQMNNEMSNKKYSMVIDTDRLLNETNNRSLVNKNVIAPSQDNDDSHLNYIVRKKIIGDGTNNTTILLDSHDKQIERTSNIASPMQSTEHNVKMGKSLNMSSVYIKNLKPFFFFNTTDIENIIEDNNETQIISKLKEKPQNNSNIKNEEPDIYSMAHSRDYISKKLLNDFVNLSDVSMDDDAFEKSSYNIYMNASRKSLDDLQERGLKSDDHESFKANYVNNVKNITTGKDDYATIECVEGNKSYKNGDIFNRGCNERCACSHGEWTCRPRCKLNEIIRGQSTENEDCYEVFTEDECCSIVQCHSEQISSSTNSYNRSRFDPLATSLPIECHFNDAVYKFRERLEIGCSEICHCGKNGKMNCQPRCAEHNHTRVEKCVLVKDPKDICCQLELCDVTLDDHEQTPTPIFLVNNDDATFPINESEVESTCLHKNMLYTLGQQFHDSCDALCICTGTGVHCSKLECPSAFGLDVLDSHCLHWEPEPASFRAILPKCCPERMRCVDKGVCVYKGQEFENWSPIPSNLTGCEEHCYCENGKVECRPACPPVLALPPSDLPCHQSLARIQPVPDDDCCMHWACASAPTNEIKSESNGFVLNNLQSNLQITSLDALNERTVHVVLIVPQIYVNLHGRIELRYTNSLDNDTSTWKTQVFAPPEDLIATSQLEFELPNLEPNSQYKIKAALILRDLNFQPHSQIYTIKTPTEDTITSPILDYRPNLIDISKNIENIELRVLDVNATCLELGWNEIPESELGYIDGIQIRYKKMGESVSVISSRLQKRITSYMMLNLSPDSDYEIEFNFIPHNGPAFKLGDPIKAHTTAKVDIFAFHVILNITSVMTTSAEFNWHGIPYPEDKYIHIYRAIYHSESEKEEFSIFKTAILNSSQNNMIAKNLKPGTKYHMWLEIYLTNGNIKKSNVITFVTKPGVPNLRSKNEELITASLSEQRVNNFYGPFVVVSIVAALGIMSTLVLLLILTRRRLHNSASITPTGRKNDAAFDNPSYKVELHQETMNL